jgi:hypothetical protein
MVDLGLIVRSLSLLFLLAYVLFRQGRSLRQLGVTARWSDLGLGLALAGLGLVPYAINDLVVHGTLGSWLVSGLSLGRMSLLGLVSLLCAAAMHGLVLRAYIMTEVLALTSRAVLAVVASVGLEELYHFEYRTPTVASLLISAFFYWKTRRVTPIVLGICLSGLWILLHQTGS